MVVLFPHLSRSLANKQPRGQSSVHPLDARLVLPIVLAVSGHQQSRG